MLQIQNLFPPLDEDALESYSKSFSQKISQSYFFANGKSYIDGKEIMKFSEIKQINFFILKAVFEKWKSEISQLKSPYFNYAKEEVQIALKKFMNTLSQHIYIEQDVFNLLLLEAVKDTLSLVLNPINFYLSILKNPKETSHPISSLKDFSKYLVFNKDLFLLFIKHLEYAGKNYMTSEETIAIFEKVFKENPHLVEPMENRIQQFNAALPIDLNQLILNDKITIEVQNPTPLEIIPKETVEQHNSKEDEKPDNFFHHTTLNDTLKKDSNTLLDKLQHEQLANIRTAINLNQKFLFINQLFGGNASEFNQALDKIEMCHSLEEIKRILQNEYAPKYHWNAEEEAVKEFFGLLEKKFE